MKVSLAMEGLKGYQWLQLKWSVFCVTTFKPGGVLSETLYEHPLLSLTHSDLEIYITSIF